MADRNAHPSRSRRRTVDAALRTIPRLTVQRQGVRIGEVFATRRGEPRAALEALERGGAAGRTPCIENTGAGALLKLPPDAAGFLICGGRRLEIEALAAAGFLEEKGPFRLLPVAPDQTARFEIGDFSYAVDFVAPPKRERFTDPDEALTVPRAGTYRTPKAFRTPFLQGQDRLFLTVLLTLVGLFGLPVYKLHSMKITPPKIIRQDKPGIIIILDQPRETGTVEIRQPGKEGGKSVDEPAAKDAAPARRLTPAERRAAAREKVKDLHFDAVLAKPLKDGKNPFIPLDIEPDPAAPEPRPSPGDPLAGLETTGASPAVGDLGKIRDYPEVVVLDHRKHRKVETRLPASIDDDADAGVRSRRHIFIKMKRYRPLLKSKYVKVLRLYPDAEGKIVVRFTIQPSGRITGARILHSGFAEHPEFEREILALVARIEFEPAGGAPVTVDYPFVFFQGE